MSGEQSKPSGQPDTPQPSNSNSQTHNDSTSDPPNPSNPPTTASATTNAGTPGDSCQSQADETHDSEVQVVPVTMSYDASQQPEIDYTSIPIDNARPTRNGEFYHSGGIWSIRASALMHEMTEEDRRELGLNDFDGDINPPNQSQGTSASAARNSTPNRTSGDPDEPLYLAHVMNRREDINSQSLDSTPSASDGTAPADMYSHTPNNTPQVNGEGNIRDHRAGVLNDTFHNRPTATNLEDLLDDLSPEDSRAWSEALSQNNEPSACMSEFMTNSSDCWNLFENNSSAIPPTTAAARLSDYLPQEQHELAWTAELPGHAFNPMRRPDTPLPTGEIENGNAQARGSLDDLPSLYVSDLQLRTPTREMVAVLARFSQYPEDEASSAAPGEDTVAGS